MSDDEQSDSGFKVVDKRRFEEDGSAKNTSTKDPNDGEKKAAAKPKPAEVKESSQSTPEQAQGEIPETVDFPSFVISLATQTLVMLGEMPHPETNQLTENLPAAKQTIEIVAMLDEKTKGNLTKEEERLVAEVLSSLRIAYVKKKGS